TPNRTLFFALQGENPAGCNLPSTLIQKTINAGQQLEIELPTAIRGAGEAWTGYVISASLTNDSSTLVQLARVEALDTDDSVVPLPVTLTLSSDDHFKLSESVASPAALPATGLIPGMRRGVSSLSYVFEYDPLSTEPIDSPVVLSASPNPGRWIRVGGFSRVPISVGSPGGCAQDIRGISEAVISTRRYACDGSNGRKRTFWLTNAGTDAIASGQRVMVAITLNDIPRSATFEGLLRCVFRGYANTTTGALRTLAGDGSPMRGINQEVLFENTKTDLIFEDELAAGEAYVLDIYPNFIPAYLNNEIVKGALIKVFPTIASQAGAYTEAGDALGDRIYPQYDRGLVVPKKGAAAVKVLKRSGLVNSRSFLAQPETIVSGFLANTSDQSVRINGSGAVYRGTDTQLDTEARRARVDCVAGVSNPSPWSAATGLVGSAGITVTLTYPSNGTNATIRSNYPDPLLAGLTGKAELNPLYVTIYVRAYNSVIDLTTIKKYSGLPIVDGATQIFEISDWDEGVTIASVPGAPSADFCPFQAISASFVGGEIGSGNLPSAPNDISVAYAFEYDGSIPSSISHSTAYGCLHTSSLTLAEVEDAIAYWAPPVANYAALPTTGNLLGQARQTIDDGTIYRWNGTAWSAITTQRYWRPPVANFAALPMTGNTAGAVCMTLDTGNLYRWTGTTWSAIGGGSGSGFNVLKAWRMMS
ncbi:hypothetical protein, partial [Pantanalinema sp. GBBB05]|uniref:hypothetical protein n=1 Tax=Pantanalinema sp. GBBB05 TaxID=2604139 RepID=UPI003D81AEB5